MGLWLRYFGVYVDNCLLEVCLFVYDWDFVFFCRWVGLVEYLFLVWFVVLSVGFLFDCDLRFYFLEVGLVFFWSLVLCRCLVVFVVVLMFLLYGLSGEFWVGCLVCLFVFFLVIIVWVMDIVMNKVWCVCVVFV